MYLGPIVIHTYVATTNSGNYTHLHIVGVHIRHTLRILRAKIRAASLSGPWK